MTRRGRKLCGSVLLVIVASVFAGRGRGEAALETNTAARPEVSGEELGREVERDVFGLMTRAGASDAWDIRRLWP